MPPPPFSEYAGQCPLVAMVSLIFPVPPTDTETPYKTTKTANKAAHPIFTFHYRFRQNRSETMKSYISAAAWHAKADPIKAYNIKNPEHTKRLPPVDNVRATAWMLTIPASKHLIDEVKDTLESGCYAAIFSEEAGSHTGYRHYQTLAVYKSRATGTQVRGMFSDAHVEPAKKVIDACRQYVSKERTHISGPYSIGHCDDVPGMEITPQEERRKDIYDYLNTRIEDGWHYLDFVRDPEYRAWALTHKQQILDLTEAHEEETFGNTDRGLLLPDGVHRALSVDYIWGPTEVHKTGEVLDLYGRKNVFKTKLSKPFPFDNYKGQEVLLLDDFRSDLRFNDLIIILDSYPYDTNIKGSHAWACWTKVVISANIPLSEQYPNLSERKDPLLRRFEHGIVFEKATPDVALPYASREDAMKGVRNDGGVNGVPGFAPSWKRAASSASSTRMDGSGFTDDDFDRLLNR
jgi:hypothetical protein